MTTNTKIIGLVGIVAVALAAGVADGQVVASPAKTSMAKSFSIPLTRTAGEMLAEAKVAASKAGATVDGDTVTGTFQGKGVRGEYRVDGTNVTVTITDKPFIAPWSLVESKVRAFFAFEGGKPGGIGVAAGGSGVAPRHRTAVGSVPGPIGDGIVDYSGGKAAAEAGAEAAVQRVYNAGTTLASSGQAAWSGGKVAARRVVEKTCQMGRGIAAGASAAWDGTKSAGQWISGGEFNFETHGGVLIATPKAPRRAFDSPGISAAWC